MNKFYSWRRPSIKPEWRYKFTIELPKIHGQGDPRKAWMYECCTGRWSCEDLGDSIRYRFGQEDDHLMFVLRWSNHASDQPGPT